ncbi:hypothetical protein Tcan_16859 [Toxocara canis]|uniref:Uncharacterized protein n=2 Tax=Toxocara canis TaxID=6265 RepID=A0A0B2V914_TOXCA|nr:hypothetical protein Tcan_16859 [Toxocara canis]VDM49941.1 unnamed protein product [Toxocara canis]
MHITSVLLLFVVAVACERAFGCDIIVHLKSDTDKKFEAQITAPNGKKSDKWTFTKKREKKTFQQNPDECGIKDWQITTYENGKQVADVKVSLNGIGRVTYKVGDDLKPVQKDRQGAMCTGQCAPLAGVPARTTKAPKS